jgi:glycosyltransferase A (GT-A) superfamily protein (DUF2064 family)
MDGGIRDLLGMGFDTVTMIGSDLPDLPPDHVRIALDILARRPEVLVLGPAEDGGYYLIGVTRPHPELFAGIPWDTPFVLERTCSAAKALAIPVEQIPSWCDVDAAADLGRLCRAAAPESARHTRSWLADAPPQVRARIDGARMI